MSRFTNRADLLIAAGESIKMQENAGIEAVGKCGGHGPFPLANYMFDEINWDFPIAVVEGKPVFVGDELYTEDGRKFIAPIGNSFGEYMTFGAGHKWSWNPHNPRTVMVELLRDDADFIARGYENDSCESIHRRVARNCRKALEEQ